MKKTTIKYITYLYPGIFFPETDGKEVKSYELPKILPKNCYGFSFSETDYIQDGKESYTGKTRNHGKTYLIGEKIKAQDIPNTENNHILISNINCNSPTKTGVKTYMGNWQIFDRNTIVVPPEKFTFK